MLIFLDVYESYENYSEFEFRNVNISILYFEFLLIKLQICSLYVYANE